MKIAIVGGDLMAVAIFFTKLLLRRMTKIACLMGSLMVHAAPVAKRPLVFYEGHPISTVSPKSPTQLQGFSELVVAFAYNRDIRWQGAGARLKRQSVTAEYEICQSVIDEDLARGGQGFKSQYTSFFCSGVFIGRRHVLTAAHCLEDLKCQDFSLIRNAREDVVSRSVDQNQVFGCKDFHIIPGGLDLALIETHQDYTGPLPTLSRHSPRVGEKVFMLGHPLGLPLHLARGIVREPGQEKSFLAQISAFEGNSGSPVFSQSTGHLMGLLIEGEEDFYEDKAKACSRLKRCPSGQCTGETVSLVPPELSGP